MSEKRTAKEQARHETPYGLSAGEKLAFESGFELGAHWQASKRITEKEIDAAIEAMHKFYELGDSPLTRKIYRDLALSALGAARKQVEQ